MIHNFFDILEAIEAHSGVDLPPLLLEEIYFITSNSALLQGQVACFAPEKLKEPWACLMKSRGKPVFQKISEYDSYAMKSIDLFLQNNASLLYAIYAHTITENLANRDKAAEEQRECMGEWTGLDSDFLGAMFLLAKKETSNEEVGYAFMQNRVQDSESFMSKPEVLLVLESLRAKEESLESRPQFLRHGCFYSSWARDLKKRLYDILDRMILDSNPEAELSSSSIQLSINDFWWPKSPFLGSHRQLKRYVCEHDLSPIERLSFLSLAIENQSLALLQAVVGKYRDWYSDPETLISAPSIRDPRSSQLAHIGLCLIAEAVHFKFLEGADFLLQSLFEESLKEKGLEALLLSACATNYKAAIAYALSQSATVASGEEGKHSPLYVAAMRNHWDCFDFLIEQAPSLSLKKKQTLATSRLDGETEEPAIEDWLSLIDNLERAERLYTYEPTDELAEICYTLKAKSGWLGWTSSLTYFFSSSLSDYRDLLGQKARDLECEIAQNASLDSPYPRWVVTRVRGAPQQEEKKLPPHPEIDTPLAPDDRASSYAENLASRDPLTLSAPESTEPQDFSPVTGLRRRIKHSP